MTEKTCADRKNVKLGEFCGSEEADPAACNGCRAYPFLSAGKFSNGSPVPVRHG